VGNGVLLDSAKHKLYDEVRGNFRAFLAARQDGKPFCYWFGPTNTHRAWIKGSGKSLWNIDPDSLKGKMPPFLPDVPEVREDLAPTFLEAGGQPVPAVMTVRSLWPVLKSGKSGLVDPSSREVFTGRERHVECARADYSPYPQRAIRTADHVLIINFRPDRWPLGDPYGLDGGASPSVSDLERNTRSTHPDEDASPTKAWLVRARLSPEWRTHYEWVYGKRPKYELYDLRKDPHETRNLADDPAHAAIKADLEKRLLDELTRTGDPRMIDDGRFFETPPMAGPLPDEEEFWKKKPANTPGPGKPKP
jgi:N-sulfoglucosamine sulfohydrolase